MFHWFYDTCLHTDLWFQSASSPCPNRTRATWAGATRWPKTSCQTAKTLVRDATAEASGRACWACAAELCCLPTPPHRKQRADCCPRVFLRGVHAPAAGPQPTESQRLHPSGPKGLFPLYPSVIAPIWFPRPVWRKTQMHLKMKGNEESRASKQSCMMTSFSSSSS